MDRIRVPPFTTRAAPQASGVCMPVAPAFEALSEERFVSLTTFRRTSVPVSTPVWIASDGHELIVTTPKHSSKVKRLRNSGAVELRPCNRMGRVVEGAPAVAGEASIHDDDASRDRLTSIFSRKYRLEYRVFLFLEALGRPGPADPVLLRITPV